MKKVYGYIRVSTTDQADSGLGLQAQRDAIDVEYRLKWGPLGYEWGGVYEDAAVSGGKPFLSRPAGLKVSTTADAGDVILFSKLDRAFRSTVDCLQTTDVWRARRVRIVFLDFNLDTETPVGEFTLTVMAAVARFERRRLGERTKEGLAVARSKGRLEVQNLMTIKNVRDHHGKLRRYVQPDVFALGQRVIEWRNRNVGWGAIKVTLRDGGVTRPRKNIIGRFKEYDWWSETAIRRLHRATILTQLWLSQGKVKWPPGWAVVGEVKDTSEPTA